MDCGAIHLAIPVDGAYRRRGKVAAESAKKGSSLPVEVHFIDWSVCDRARLEALGSWHGSAIAWSRLYLSQILPADVDWVISCDADVLFRGDVARLWALRDERFVVMMSRDSLPPWHKENPAIGGFCRANGLDAGEILCSGLSLINLRRWRQEGWQAKVDEFVARHGDAPFLDQTALNVVFQDEKRALPRAWGCFSGDLNDDVDYNGDCVIHYVSDPPWKRGKLTQLMSDAVVLWRQEAGMPCGGWRRWLYLLLRATSSIWRRNRWMAWHFRNAITRSENLDVLHICAGWQSWNGAAAVARLIMDEQEREGHRVSFATWAGIRRLRSADEVWIHCAWRPCLWWAAVWGRNVHWTPAGSYDPIRLRHHGLKKRLVGPIERFCLRRAKMLVATCEAERTWIQSYLGKRCPPVEVMDIRRFFKLPTSPPEPFSGNRPLHLLYMGRRHPLKGLEFLEKAVKDSRDVELRIVSNAFGDEKEKVWNWCDVLVLPTLSDNFGLVVAEALERGKRVITTDGAPAWGDGNTYGGRLVCLKGYRDGTDEVRRHLLGKAIASLSARALDLHSQKSLNQ